jgi:hypothetical protein
MMMYGDDYNHMGSWFGFGHGFFGLLFWILIILVIAALLKYLFGKK